VIVRGELIKLTVFVLVALVILWGLWSVLLNATAGQTKTYTAEFTDASGLVEGDNVRIAGVRVGRVDSLELDGARAAVTFSVEAARPVFQNTRVEIRYQNLIGQRYVALVPGAGPAAPLPDGATIPVARTQPSFDLSALFNGFQPLFSVLKPDDVNRLSANLLQVLQGSQPEIGPLLGQITQVTNSIADRDQLLGAVIVNLNQVLGNLAEQGPRFYTLLDQGQRLVDGLNQNSGPLFDSVDRLSGLVGRTDDLVSDIAPDVTYDVKNARRATGVFVDNRRELRDTLQAFPSFLNSLGRISSYGSYINLYACNLSIGLVPNTPPVRLGTPGDPHSEVCR
jgi:phospholipid/cholesterol/gamma-HCH transport system substrate-binding protein